MREWAIVSLESDRRKRLKMMEIDDLYSFRAKPLQGCQKQVQTYLFRLIDNSQGETTLLLSAK